MNTYSAVMGWRGHEGSVLGVRFSQSELAIISVGSEGKMQQWSLANIGKVERTFAYDQLPFGAFPADKRSPRNLDLVLEPERGRHVAVASRGGAQIFRSDSSRQVQLLGSPGRPVISLDWLARTLVTAGADGLVRMTTLSN